MGILVSDDLARQCTDAMMRTSGHMDPGLAACEFCFQQDRSTYCQVIPIYLAPAVLKYTRIIVLAKSHSLRSGNVRAFHFFQNDDLMASCIWRRGSFVLERFFSQPYVFPDDDGVMMRWCHDISRGLCTDDEDTEELLAAHGITLE